MTLTRKALKDFKFSDGTFIPKGTLIAAPSLSLHHDKNFFENPDVFEPFRFAHMREEDGKGSKHQFASTSIEYLPFGLGKHAWCGFCFFDLLPRFYPLPILLALDVSSLHVS